MSECFEFRKEPDFTGILICTDFDGTLYHHGIAPPNAAAINYFMDHGGLFTLCSGRDGRLLNGGNLPFTPNAPAACMNGGMIYDFIADKIIRRNPMTDDYPKLLEDLIEGMPLRRADIVSEDLRIGFDTADPEDFASARAKITSPVFKLVAYKAEPSDDLVPEAALRICRGRANVLSNSRNCFELNYPGIDKAFGAKLIKELTGAKLLVTVGDCNGDISMFRVADDSYAVGNAIPELKEIAGHVTESTVDDGAFPEIVRSIAYLYGGAE
ncbi:MAG: HAD hydrolase family protein [Clostridia bacterium]|nr:HAD hydrolase family protein [Clostridia bacterium]